MALPIHVAILDLDVPVPAIYNTRGLYSSIFRRLLESAASRLNATRTRPIAIHTSAWDLIGGNYPPLSSFLTSPPTHSSSEDTQSTNPLALPISAILLTGSAPAAYETATYPWIAPLADFLSLVYNDYPHVKIFGSCFGHQILAQTLLSPPLRNELCPDGREMGLVPISLTGEFRDSFPALRDRLPGDGEKMRLQMIHGDWVVPASGARDAVVLPAPWMNVGSSEACPIQGLYCPKRVLSYQGHFEFDAVVNAETCREFGRRAAWKPELMVEWLRLIELGKGKSEGEDEDDAKVAAEVVVLFFAGEDSPS
ncbi:hypothetical protein P170DRAFT_443458 [Aspergillus steynii IBT 23096]|uniref:Class I glutamine amidotransferase-like protein n=1 Tax=Aspergillus steynii IBT 23096 TaxID=1392250 RepID=A0A2I2GS84_9EURO|nr:uncharacterized protein P170DRAFT_443458 [Aspergillus steynii IBT 23096]PLB55733.1 hypothetical protein P170DRAFT_443458 [Aspergillus steynii IBT 23096]